MKLSFHWTGLSVGCQWFKVMCASQIKFQLTAVKLKHVQTTIRPLITWAQVNYLTFRPHKSPLQAGLKCLTHTLTIIC